MMQLPTNIRVDEGSEFMFVDALSIDQGVLIDPSLSVFARMEKIAERLVMIEEDVVHGRHLETWQHRVGELVWDMIWTADEDHDAAFAVMHLEIRHPYDVIHHLMAALVCGRLALASGLTDQERFSLVAGALTHDIALLAMRGELEATAMLTERQHRLVKAHCTDGAQMLRQLGVDDDLWIQVVCEHHEYLDGSGYIGLKDPQIGTPSRIMALADAFSAMLRPRPYRGRINAKKALADLYADSEGRYDKGLVRMLLLELGLFPPGSVLQLANCETAVAIRPRRGFPQHPEVVAIINARDQPFSQAMERDTSRKETEIVSLLAPERAGASRDVIAPCWEKPG